MADPIGIMPTAVIVDDSPLLRAQLREILARIGTSVIGEVGSGVQLTELYARHRPDLIILDIVMPGMDGVTAAIELLRAYPEARIVMCSSLIARDKILECRRAGVRHYLLKPFNPARAEEIFRFALQPSPTDPAGKTP